MKTALIFGISGQDGAYLAALLLKKKYRVVGTTRSQNFKNLSNLTALGIQNEVSLFTVAIECFENVKDTIANVKPDEIYHLAGQSSVSLSFKQPRETILSTELGILNILESMRTVQKTSRLFYASSGDCFGSTGNSEATEETPFHPQSPYAVAKAAGQSVVNLYRNIYELFACSGILFNHESPLRPSHFVTRKIVSTAARIAQGAKERLRLGNIDVVRDWGYAPEYVDAMWRMLQSALPEDYIIATGQSVTLREFTSAAFATVGLDWQNYVDIDRSLFRETDVLQSRANPEKAARQLGWKARRHPLDVVATLLQHEQALGEKRL